MSRRPVAPQPRSSQTGVFKDLFQPSPEFPLRDHFPSRRPCDLVEVGAPASIQGLESFEIVGTLLPFKRLETAMQLKLAPVESRRPSSDPSAGPSERNNLNDMMDMDNDNMQFAEEVLRDLDYEGEDEPDKPTQPSQSSPIPDENVVLTVEVRRISNESMRIYMAGLVKRIVEETVQMKLSTDALPPTITYAEREVESTCSPILSRVVMMWSSSDQKTSDNIANVVLSCRRLQRESPMEAFFREVFYPLGDNEFTLYPSGGLIPLPSDDPPSLFEVSTSKNTKWDLTSSFSLPEVLQDGRIKRRPTPLYSVFAGLEFRRPPNQPTSSRRQRLV